MTYVYRRVGGWGVQGDGAMQRMARSSVLVSGLGGLGVEIGMPYPSTAGVRKAVHYLQPCE